MKQEVKIRSLHANEIECRVGSISDWGVSLLLYKNARVDQAILDEVFGIYGWQRSHMMIGNSLYCTVSVWDHEKQTWISKQDVGTTGEFEKEKSVASDSFKRACVNLGIGRELYTAPSIYIPANQVQMGEKDRKRYVKDKFFVKIIEVSEEKEITGLVIENQKHMEVYRYGTVNTQKSELQMQEKMVQSERSNIHNFGNDTAAQETTVQSECRTSVGMSETEQMVWQELYQELQRTGVPEEKLLQRYGVSSLSELDETARRRALNGLKRTKTAA